MSQTTTFSRSFEHIQNSGQETGRIREISNPTVKLLFASAFPGLFELDASLPGNSNSGHQYAAGITPIIKLDKTGKPVKNAAGQVELEKLPPISDSQRQALIEYLKTI
ncbi:MAG: hypothetical protein PHY16_11395 [Methylobacter sp.]|nr:hypothetical protein [Methylobacter sp.]